MPEDTKLGMQLDKLSRHTEIPQLFKLYTLQMCLNMYLVDAKCPNPQIRTFWSFGFGSINYSFQVCRSHSPDNFRFSSEMRRPRNFGYFVWNKNQISLMFHSGKVWDFVKNNRYTKTCNNKDKSWQYSLQSVSIDAAFPVLSSYKPCHKPCLLPSWWS